MTVRNEALEERVRLLEEYIRYCDAVEGSLLSVPFGVFRAGYRIGFDVGITRGGE